LRWENYSDRISLIREAPIPDLFVIAKECGTQLPVGIEIRVLEETESIGLEFELAKEQL
jgi:hypothetical protein